MLLHGRQNFPRKRRVSRHIRAVRLRFPVRAAQGARTDPHRIADRPGNVQKCKPQRHAFRSQVAPTRYPQSPLRIAAFPARAQHARRVAYGEQMPSAAGEFIISLRLLAMPGTMLPLWVMAVVMVLMHGHDDGGNVDDRLFRALLPSIPASCPSWSVQSRKECMLRSRRVRARKRNNRSTLRAASCPAAR